MTHTCTKKKKLFTVRSSNITGCLIFYWTNWPSSQVGSWTTEVNQRPSFKAIRLDNVIKEVSLTTEKIDPRSESWPWNRHHVMRRMLKVTKEEKTESYKGNQMSVV